VDFARQLDQLGFRILSTGGTAAILKKNNINVTDVSTYTGFPEMMDGRVKTLHPKIHGSLLARRDKQEHMDEAAAHKLNLIDIVAVNLYPFTQTIADPQCSLEKAIENIDIGGPTMLRSAAKNHKDVTVVVDPQDYPAVITELKQNSTTSAATRAELAVKVFQHTADYDSAIDTYLSEKLTGTKTIRLNYNRGRDLRYGENPHQKGILYYQKDCNTSNVPYGKQLHGKEMSFNNYIDADASYETVKEFTDQAAVCIIKHSNPCGLATGTTLFQAVQNAWEGDVVSAFGSVVSTTRTVDQESAAFFKNKFIEVLIAPGFTDEALSFLKQKSKNLRLIQVNDPVQNRNLPPAHYRIINGALLKQSYDSTLIKSIDQVTEKKITDRDKNLMQFAYKAVKHVKSNAIMICQEYEDNCFRVMGMGAGQPNRVDAVKKLAITKAEENIKRLYGDRKVKEIMQQCVLASDAFFPFPDNIYAAAEAGITKIIQPGGSKRDGEVIKACNETGTAMAFTGIRHFYH